MCWGYELLRNINKANAYLLLDKHKVCLSSSRTLDSKGGPEMIRPSIVASLLAAAVATSVASGQPAIYATGQLLIPGNPNLPSSHPGHYDTFEQYVYEIDVLTGVATAVSPVATELPFGLAGTASRGLFGFANGQLVQVDPASGSQTSVGPNNGLSATAFDITTSGVAFIVPFDADFNTQQVQTIDLSTGSATSKGSARAIGDAIDLARGTPLGTAEPLVISLGSIGSTLYGVELETDSLVAIDSNTGSARVVGAIGAVGAGNGGGYSGFSALTGVDLDRDGEFDALVGTVNQLIGGSSRLGGIARFDLNSGDWTLLGTNPGVVFYGLGSSPADSLACSPADLSSPASPGTPDGILMGADFFEFLSRFQAGDLSVDFSSPTNAGVPDGALSGADFFEFLDLFSQGC